MNPEQSTRDRARGIFAYLKSFVELRTKVVRRVDQYEELIWLSDAPREPECRCELWNWGQSGDESDVWLEVKRPAHPDPPTPPEPLRKWLLREDWTSSKLDFPSLQKSIIEPPVADGESARLLRLEEYPEVEKDWERYVEEKWWPWQAEDRRLRPVFDLYGRLFGIHQQILSSGEQFELAVGFGLLNGVNRKGQVVRRHLLTARASVQFDSRRGLLTVGPPGEGSKLVLEQDMLDPEDRPHQQEIRALEEELQGLGESVWNSEGIRQILRAWANSYSADCSYSDSSAYPPESARPAQIVLAPALILRRRNERFWVAAFQEILRQIDTGVEVPVGVARFADRGGGCDGPLEGEEGEERRTWGSEEIYFPLPANDEQRRILERLDASDGVVVQGPPGTGKSHTIVNLICHLLAGGKRVLVTSHTARALRVLKRYIAEKIPAVAPLAVLQLGEGPDSLTEMERSVQGITTKQHTWDRAACLHSIRARETELEKARKEQSAALRVLRECRERETYRHDDVSGRYSGTLAEIATRLREERLKLSWLPDEGRIGVACPVSDSEFCELSSSLENREVVELARSPWTVPDLRSLPSVRELAEVVQRRDASKRKLEQIPQVRTRHLVDQVRALPLDARRSYSELINLALTGVRELRGQKIDWAVRALREFSTGQIVKWKDLHESTGRTLSQLSDHIEWYDRTPASWPADLDLHRVKAGAEELRSHFEKGGWRGLFGPIRPEVVRRNEVFRKQVSIGGRPCWTVEELQRLLRWIRCHEHLESLSRRWHGVLSGSLGGDLEAVATYRDSMSVLGRAMEVADQLRLLRERLSAELALEDSDWTDPAMLQELMAAISGADAADELAAHSARVLSISTCLELPEGAKRLSPSWTILRNSLQREDLATYEDGLDLAKSERDVLQRAERLREILGRFRTAVPLLTAALEQGNESMAAAMHPEGIEAAWAWRSAWAWLQQRIDPAADERARLALDDADGRVRALVSEIAADKAWLHCFDRLTTHEREHLVAWSHSVRRIGKGTGKYAAKHRDDARQHMNECRSAIPAWVMPLYRVAETVSPVPQTFDVAIIDEASQSGPEALILTYLAKKVVVVGDDQQISPSFVGLDREAAYRLRDEHLEGVEHRDHFGTESSFFTLADIRFPGRVRLREHFRCMPEIINFSNDLSYAAAPLLPLRQFGSARLTPVVQAVFVEDGFMKGTGQRKSNPGEVRAIVDWLARAVRSPAYSGKSFGVISLLGEWQAREIERLLVAELGPEVFGERQVICGDAYAFQGDERDVILLSMVAAPSETQHIGVLSKEDDRRRFNVAASRARDQMVLFHSVQLADLSQKCFRHRLLSYCLNPVGPRLVAGELSLDELRVRASRPDRGRMRPPDPFESWFEVDVYLMLAARNYRVIPQHKVHGYRIDLVVETPRDRVAVECDGSQWHGPDRIEADLGRQRELERCGWTFYRVPESRFRLDAEEALADLWRLLESRERSSEGPTRPDLRLWASNKEESPDEQSEPELASGEKLSGAAPTPSADNEAGSLVGDSTTHKSGGGVSSKLDAPQREGGSVAGAAGERQEGIGYRSLRGLEPYSTWTTRPLPDPLTARPGDLIEGLIEIVAVEGPVLGERLARLFVVAAGGQRAGKRLRHEIANAVRRAVRAGQLAILRDFGSTDFEASVVHLPDRPSVRLRERGPRSFEEIPSSEIEQMMALLQKQAPSLRGDSLNRLVVSSFGFGRMTENMHIRLRAIASHRDAARGTQQSLGLDPVN